jgi:hypothetical protein
MSAHAHEMIKQLMNCVIEVKIGQNTIYHWIREHQKRMTETFGGQRPDDHITQYSY